MADTEAWVVNENGASVAPAGDSLVHIFPAQGDLAMDLIDAQDAEEDDTGLAEVLGKADRKVYVDLLILIAELAETVLDSEYGGKPEDLARLALALKTGGFKDLTHLFPEVV